MSNTQRKVARKSLKDKVGKLVTAIKKGRKRDYIVRINIDNLRSVAVISLQATSRQEAVELVKGAIELTGEVAPINLPSLERTKDMIDEEIVEAAASEVEAVESAE